MSYQTYPSQLLEDAVEQFAKLPGIGRKTAFRLVLQFLRWPIDDVLILTHSLERLCKEIMYCKICNNISDTDICSICSDTNRRQNIICIVESVKDVISIENTGQYNGLYHVLGGVISPIDGIGPSDLKIDNLEKRLESNNIEELIMALSPTAEGDTTAFYLFRKLERFDITFSTIAKGISIGDELEYVDAVTLGRSILNRIPLGLTK